MTDVVLSAIQMNPKLLDVDFNIQATSEFIEKAAEMGSEVIVLPELANTGYVIPSRKELEMVAEAAPRGKTLTEWEKLAKRYGVFIVGGFAERDGNKIYNASVLLGPNGFIGTYRKIHLFGREKQIFDPGDKDLWVNKTEKNVNIGLLICFDWIFPEVARILALKGAEVICHPANLVLPWCPEAMVTRAVENRVFVVTANRIGRERRGGRELRFTGESQIVAPGGKILLRASPDREEVGIADIEPSISQDKAVTGENDLFSDRRPDLYHRLVGR